MLEHSQPGLSLSDGHIGAGSGSDVFVESDVSCVRKPES